MFIQIQTILYFLLGILDKQALFLTLNKQKNNGANFCNSHKNFSLSDHSNLSRLVQLIKKN